jgi:uncharacterized iron-regulated membrane protein
MPFRAIFFWFHLVTGLTAGAIVLVMAATGVLLTYEKPIVRWAESGLAAASPSPATRRLSVEALLGRVMAQRPGAAPTAVTMSRAPDAPVVVAVDRDGGVWLVNAYTGGIIGPGSRARVFFRAVTEWHRWLGRSGESRSAGRAVTGAANLAFLCLVLSGMYIWLPRFWTWRLIRGLLWFRKSATTKARDFNWHHVFGFWAAVPLVIIVASGVVMSYPWANALVYRAAGETAPPAGAPAARGERRDLSPGSTAGLDRALARAEAVDDWRTLTLRIPSTRDRQVVITIDRGAGGQPQRRGQLTVDRTTGEATSWEPFESLSAGRRFRSLLRFAHTGEVLGLAGQTIAGLASLSAVMLACTGLALSIRRFAAWRRRRAAGTQTRAINAA